MAFPVLALGDVTSVLCDVILVVREALSAGGGSVALKKIILSLVRWRKA